MGIFRARVMVPRLDDLAKMPRARRVISPWLQASCTELTLSYLITAGTLTFSSGSMVPESSIAAKVRIFCTEPGS